MAYGEFMDLTFANFRPRTEVLWMNYPEPDELHDISCVGRDYRDRWRLKKLVRRWRAR